MKSLSARALSGALLALGPILANCATAASTPCDAARAHVKDCFGTELAECSDASAEDLLGKSCEEIAASADPANKADGGFCPGFLWWLCGDEGDFECAAAGDGADYAQFTNEQKMSFNWEKGLCSQIGPGGVENYAKGTKLITDAIRGASSTILRLGRAFSNNTDVLDHGRVKLIHPYGSLVQTELQRTPVDATCHTDYTGVWGEDRVSGLARLGWGISPQLSGGYVPGAAVKFFVEGGESVNLQLINSLEGDPAAPNFFSKSLTNNLPEPTSAAVKGLKRLFGLFADDPLHLRLEHMAKVSTDGTRIAANEVVAPYQVWYEPTEAARSLYQEQLAANPDVDFREAFAAFPVGTQLFNVFVTSAPGACREKLGVIITQSDFVASKWGDSRLHFQHATEAQGF